MNKRNASAPGTLAGHSAGRDTPEVREAERRVGAVLDELEERTQGEVLDIDLDELVDTGDDGRPVIRKAVDITLRQRPGRQWLRS